MSLCGIGKYKLEEPSPITIISNSTPPPPLSVNQTCFHLRIKFAAQEAVLLGILLTSVLTVLPASDDLCFLLNRKQIERWLALSSLLSGLPSRMTNRPSSEANDEWGDKLPNRTQQMNWKGETDNENYQQIKHLCFRFPTNPGHWPRRTITIKI